MHDTPCVTGARTEGVHITNRAVDDEPHTAALFGVELNELADDRIVGVALGVDHQYVTRLEQGQGLVDIEIITGPGFDGQCGTHQFACGVVAGQASGANVTAEVVADVRGDHRSESFDD
ncbi:hypothetical protein D3C78_1518560 [compost metagenome]